jgi:hypothetical protein
VLDRANNHIGHAQDGVAGKSDYNFFLVQVLGEAGQFQRPLDHGTEVLVGDMWQPRPTYQPGAEDVGRIGLLELLQAVSRYDDDAWELGEFVLLVMSSGAVVAVKMSVFL